MAPPEVCVADTYSHREGYVRDSQSDDPNGPQDSVDFPSSFRGFQHPLYTELSKSVPHVQFRQCFLTLWEKKLPSLAIKEEQIASEVSLHFQEPPVKTPIAMETLCDEMHPIHVTEQENTQLQMEEMNNSEPPKIPEDKQDTCDGRHPTTNESPNDIERKLEESRQIEAAFRSIENVIICLYEKKTISKFMSSLTSQKFVPVEEWLEPKGKSDVCNSIICMPTEIEKDRENQLTEPPSSPSFGADRVEHSEQETEANQNDYMQKLVKSHFQKQNKQDFCSTNREPVSNASRNLPHKQEGKGCPSSSCGPGAKNPCSEIKPEDMQRQVKYPPKKDEKLQDPSGADPSDSEQSNSSSNSHSSSQDEGGDGSGGGGSGSSQQCSGKKKCAQKSRGNKERKEESEDDDDEPPSSPSFGADRVEHSEQETEANQNDYMQKLVKSHFQKQNKQDFCLANRELVSSAYRNPPDKQEDEGYPSSSCGPGPKKPCSEIKPEDMQRQPPKKDKQLEDPGGADPSDSEQSDSSNNSHSSSQDEGGGGSGEGGSGSSQQRSGKKKRAQKSRGSKESKEESEDDDDGTTRKRPNSPKSKHGFSSNVKKDKNKSAPESLQKSPNPSGAFRNQSADQPRSTYNSKPPPKTPQPRTRNDFSSGVIEGSELDSKDASGMDRAEDIERSQRRRRRDTGYQSPSTGLLRMVGQDEEDTQAAGVQPPTCEATVSKPEPPWHSRHIQPPVPKPKEDGKNVTEESVPRRELSPSPPRPIGVQHPIEAQVPPVNVTNANHQDGVAIPLLPVGGNRAPFLPGIVPNIDGASDEAEPLRPVAGNNANPVRAQLPPLMPDNNDYDDEILHLRNHVYPVEESREQRMEPSAMVVYRHTLPPVNDRRPAHLRPLPPLLEEPLTELVPITVNIFTRDEQSDLFSIRGLAEAEMMITGAPNRE